MVVVWYLLRIYVEVAAMWWASSVVEGQQAWAVAAVGGGRCGACVGVVGSRHYMVGQVWLQVAMLCSSMLCHAMQLYASIA